MLLTKVDLTTQAFPMLAVRTTVDHNEGVFLKRNYRQCK